MKLKLLPLIFFLILLLGCKQEREQLVRIEGKLVPITDSLPIDRDLDDFIKPFREHVNNNLDSVLAYSMQTYTKSDGELNTALGNFFADVVYEQANPVFNRRTNQNIDIVLLNHGGIRSIISKGDITMRTAYEIMPFENSIVVAAVKGSNINDMVDYLVSRKRAHPVAGLQIILDKKGDLKATNIKGKPIDSLKTYYLATNDYLYNGGDGMEFFKPNDSLYVLDYKLRNALIDYFKKADTINPVRDNRFIQLDE